MSRRSAWFGVLLVITALTLGGCSPDEPGVESASPAGGTTTDGGATPDGGGDATEGVPDPCELITDEEASAALGQPVGEREVFGTVERECQISPATGIDGYLTIRIGPGNRTGYDLAMQTMSETFPDRYREVDGVGDVAFTIGNEVTVLTGDYLIVFFISVGVPGDDIDERALTMARAGTARA
jgi:hypothetical protein